jgi:hypothetical protein
VRPVQSSPAGAGPISAWRSSLLEGGRDQGAASCRVLPPVLHPGRSVGVVAARDLADPVGAIAGHRREGRRRLAPGQQPHHVPAAACDGVLSRALVALQFADRQVRLEPKVSCHAGILQHRLPNWYEPVWTRSGLAHRAMCGRRGARCHYSDFGRRFVTGPPNPRERSMRGHQVTMSSSALLLDQIIQLVRLVCLGAPSWSWCWDGCTLLRSSSRGARLVDAVRW